MDNSIKEQIRRAGGQTAIARALGIPVTTVHAWGVAGKVPAWRLAQFEHVIATQAAAA